MFEWVPLSTFKGNRLTAKEKKVRLISLEKNVSDGEIDKSFIPYLHRFNKFKFIMTTQCCCGHGESPAKGGRRAHIDFRSVLTEAKTIDLILRPLDEALGINVGLMMDCNRLRYVIWLHNRKWKKETEYFLRLLARVERKLCNGEIKKSRVKSRKKRV